MDPIMKNSESPLDVLLQENRSLKMKINSLENSVDYLKEDNEKLLEKIDNVEQILNTEREGFKTTVSRKELELFNLKESFDNFKEDVENEKQQNELCNRKKTDVEDKNGELLLLQLNECREEIKDLNSQMETYKNTEEEMVLLKQKIELLENDKNLLRVEFEETKNLLEMKTQQLQEITTALEELKEEKALLCNELAALKSAPSNSDNRGNSLFGEVDDRRRAMTMKLKILYNKYMALKRDFLRKNKDYDALTAELKALQTKFINIQESGPKADNRFITAQKNRIKDLEHLVTELEKRPEDPHIVKVTDSNSSWAVMFIEKARKEAAELRSELCRYSLNIHSVEETLRKKTSEALKLTEEVVKLRAENMKLKIDIETNKYVNNDTATDVMNDDEKDCKENIPERTVLGKKVHFDENVRK